jgi:hypothetical protein
MEKREKWLLGFLTFFSLGALFLGFLKIKSGIYGPFWRPVETKPFDSASLHSAPLTRLGTIDTDEDGLSDFEETYIYKTSIYLPDTDSDGLSDKEEIEKGYDPLCAKGRDCHKTTRNQTNGVSPEAKRRVTSDGVSAAAPQRVTSDLSVDEIRNLLLEAGVSEDFLEQVDDETLREVYEETIREVSN